MPQKITFQTVLAAQKRTKQKENEKENRMQYD